MIKYSTKKHTLRQGKLAARRSRQGLVVRMMMLGFIAFMSVCYVTKTSTVSTKGYDISEIQREITVLDREIERIDYEIATYRSMVSIEERLSRTDFEDSRDARYVTVAPPEAKVATR